MPRGEPTRTVRLPAWLLDDLAPQAKRARIGLPELITRRLAPHRPTVHAGHVPKRCQCKTPTLSKFVTNLCTKCRLVR